MDSRWEGGQKIECLSSYDLLETESSLWPAAAVAANEVVQLELKRSRTEDPGRSGEGWTSQYSAPGGGMAHNSFIAAPDN